MKRQLYLIWGFAILRLDRGMRWVALHMGWFMRRLGRQLVTWATDETLTWRHTLLNRCYFVDAEFHVFGNVFRGPITVAYLNRDGLFFKLNWVARKTHRGWMPEGGACDFVVRDYGPPHELPNGDIWFMCHNGNYVVLSTGSHDNIRFLGTHDTPRIYTYF